jgi:hypothetical protein
MQRLFKGQRVPGTRIFEEFLRDNKAPAGFRVQAPQNRCPAASRVAGEQHEVNRGEGALQVMKGSLLGWNQAYSREMIGIEAKSHKLLELRN